MSALKHTYQNKGRLNIFASFRR